jgi:cyclic pyranopterin monophosphate synthase
LFGQHEKQLPLKTINVRIMIDISHKTNTLRAAEAQAIVKVSSKETINAIKNNSVPKGDVLATSKAAALLAIKKTPEILPFCHPLPIEYTAITFSLEELAIHITVSAKTIYKTGIEVEVMHGASVAALNMYDMLKPIDNGISIENIKLLHKTGGKTSYSTSLSSNLSAAVVVCSDTVSKGLKEDIGGKLIKTRLHQLGLEKIAYSIVPDEKTAIQEALIQHQKNGCQLIIFTGGTGLSVRDVTPESITELLDREIPGIAEFARSYGQDRMPYAFLSRSVAGTYRGSLVLTLPGSTKGVEETMDALFPHVLHAFKVLRGERHD